jgi:hypothetical protein
MSDLAKMRVEISQRLELFSFSKLKQVLSYLKGLEKEEKETQRNAVDSFAGIWKDMDEDFFDDLTENLSSRRAQDIRTF